MRVLVCGGREFGKIPRWAKFGTFAYINCQRGAERERELLAATLSGLKSKGLSIIIHGCAPGADNLAERWAVQHGVAERGFPAPWRDIEHPEARVKRLPNGREYDANAGPRRNAQMIAEGKPDLVLAFAGGDGTEDMIRKAEAAGIPVRRVPEAPSLSAGGKD